MLRQNYLDCEGIIRGTLRWTTKRTSDWMSLKKVSMNVSDVRLQSRWMRTRCNGRNREHQREDSCGAYCTSTSGTLKWRARGSTINNLGNEAPQYSPPQRCRRGWGAQRWLVWTGKDNSASNEAMKDRAYRDETFEPNHRWPCLWDVLRCRRGVYGEVGGWSM